MQHVVMVVPVDRYIDEAQDISEKSWKHRPQGLPVRAVRYPKFEHHYSDDDGDNAVTECFQSSLIHCCKHRPKKLHQESVDSVFQSIATKVPARTSNPAVAPRC